MLNNDLANKRKIPQESRENIESRQELRQTMINKSREISTGTEEQKQKFLSEFRENEVILQKLWNFEDNQGLRFLQELKLQGCTCPYMDNKDTQGLRRIYHADCKWHK